MNGSHRLRLILGGLVLLAALAWVYPKFTHARNPYRREVLEIIQTNNWPYLSDKAEMKLLIALGPKALPTLSELIGHRETAFDRQYRKLWPSLPSAMRKYLPAPLDRQKLRGTAVQIVYELGPAACRPLTSVLCDALNEPSLQARDYPMRGLYWSLPESPKARAALTNYLADPTRTFLFGMLDGFELWPKLPEARELLIPWLANSQAIREVSISLGNMGTNAANAIPALLKVCDQGSAGPPLNVKVKISRTAPDKHILKNRCDGYAALGKIGIASPEVLAALHRGLEDTDDLIRLRALQSLMLLHQPPEAPLTNWLSHFPARQSYQFQQIIKWVGELNERGREALPWLRQFTALEYVRSLPEPANGSGEQKEDPEMLRLTAIIAICRVAPEETGNYLPDLVAQVGRRWEPVELLMDSKSLAEKIIAQLEPLLNETNGRRSSVAAYVILGLTPGHQKSLAVLRETMVQGKLNERIIAGNWLWKRTGETKEILPLLIEGLKAKESFIGQMAADQLAEMGPEAARPAIPALKAALWHEDMHVHDHAGKALRKLAPEEMPPIQ
jgi:hypothetical protein